MRFVLAFFLLFAGTLFADELRLWTDVSGRRIQAFYEGREGSQVLLRKTDGKVFRVAFSRLAHADRSYISKRAAGPAEQRKEFSRKKVWRPHASEDPWPESLRPSERKVLDDLGIKWAHAESQYFVVHYDRAVFAQKVARMGDYYYEYISSELKGMKDQYPRKSHIFVFRKTEKWDAFLHQFDAQYSWAAAFVRGDLMFIQESPSSRRGEDMLAHEMTHLVLNRYFRVQPPRWLNEGLAEWYEEFARASFKGVGKRPRAVFQDDLKSYMPLNVLMGADDYPDESQIRAYYATAKYMVGFLRMGKGDEVFMDYMNDIVTLGLPPEASLQKHYGYAEIPDLDQAFKKFAGVKRRSNDDRLANEK